MNTVLTLKTHSQLHDQVIYKSVEERDGLIIAESYLNYNWYDLIAPFAPLEELDWSKVKAEIEKMHNKGIHFAFYVNSKDQETVNEQLNFLGLKHNGGDAHMLLDIDTAEAPEITNDIRLEIRDVTEDTFEDYQDHLLAVHGNDEGLEVADKLAEVLFNASKNETIEQDVITILAYLDNKPVGYAAGIYSKELNLGYMTNSGVLSEFRRRGIHSQLVEYRIKHAKQLGIHNIYVITGQDSESNKSVIKRGFERVGEYEYYVVT